MFFDLLILFAASSRLFGGIFCAIDTAFDADQQDYECLPMCVCDLFMDLNRANCSRQTLIGANIGMSTYVEVLDLSHNDITIIDNQCFSHLKFLITLMLNDNSIDYIDFDAFAGLRKLHSVDLSRNRLESFDNRIFEQSPQIFNVNFAENKFMNLPDEPLIKSHSLRILDMRLCKIAHLPARMFEMLPNIRSVDLSGNLLIVMNIAPFVPTAKLKLLNIEGNPIHCDSHVELTLIKMRQNSVKVFFQNCPKSERSSSGTFDRIMALPTTSEVSGAPPIELAKVWKIKRNETCPLNDTKRLCALYNECMADRLSSRLLSEREIEFDITSRHSWMQFVNMNIAFYAGLAIGTVFGMLIVCLMSVITSKYFSASKSPASDPGQRRNRNRRNRSSVIRTATDRSAEQLQSQSMPAREGREMLRYSAHNSRRPTNSFFSLFFERPVRHRYLHQLNQSATNLMRRLSQSRLFLNSTRAENAAYRNNYARTNTRQTPADRPQSTHLDSGSDDAGAVAGTLLNHTASVALVRSVSMPSMSPEVDDIAISFDSSAPTYEEMRTCASETNIFIERAETPPPPYLDAMAESESIVVQ